MSLLAWRKIANQKEEVEKQIKNINNQIISSKLSDELGQIKFEKMFKPVTSRLDTQIEATKKLENKVVKEGEPEDMDGDEMPNFEPPPPIYEDDDEMPNFEPPPPIYEDDDEMPNFEPPQPIYERKRKEWDPISIKKATQKELNNERRALAEERRQVNALLGKLLKSGESHIKSGKYEGVSYDELLRKSENFTKQINRIEDQLLLTSQKKQRMEYKKVPFSASDLQEKSKKLKKTLRKTKSEAKPKSKPGIYKSLFDKMESMRSSTKPDSDTDSEFEGSGLNQNYKVIYYNNPEKLIKKLEVICGTLKAGNTSNEVKNQGISILDELLKLKRITKRIYEKIYNNHFI